MVLPNGGPFSCPPCRGQYFYLGAAGAQPHLPNSLTPVALGENLNQFLPHRFRGGESFLELGLPKGIHLHPILSHDSGVARLLLDNRPFPEKLARSERRVRSLG